MGKGGDGVKHEVVMYSVFAHWRSLSLGSPLEIESALKTSAITPHKHRCGSQGTHPLLTAVEEVRWKN